MSSLAGSGARDSHIKAATRWSPTTDTEEPRDSQLDASRRQGDAQNVFLGCPGAESVWRGSGAGVCITTKAVGHRCPHSRGLGLSRLEISEHEVPPKDRSGLTWLRESACQTPREGVFVFSWLTGCVWGGRGGHREGGSSSGSTPSVAEAIHGLHYCLGYTPQITIYTDVLKNGGRGRGGVEWSGVECVIFLFFVSVNYIEPLLFVLISHSHKN